MRKVILLVLLVFSLSIVSAQSEEQVYVYDLLDVSTDNFQGDVIVLSGLGDYSWGFELGYVNERGFADKNKKTNGTLGVRFVPVNDDGSYCKAGKNCSWEEQMVTIEADTGTFYAYLPAGDVYDTQLYFYVASDGTTYWAKSGHEDGPNSHIDLSFEEAVEQGHIARVGNIQKFDEEIIESSDIINDTQPIAVEDNHESVSEFVVVMIVIIFVLSLFIGRVYLDNNKKVKKKITLINKSTRRKITTKKRKFKK
jgi:hypothetical protein